MSGTFRGGLQERLRAVLRARRQEKPFGRLPAYSVYKGTRHRKGKTPVRSRPQQRARNRQGRRSVRGLAARWVSAIGEISLHHRYLRTRTPRCDLDQDTEPTVLGAMAAPQFDDDPALITEAVGGVDGDLDGQDATDVPGSTGEKTSRRQHFNFQFREAGTVF